MSEENPNIEERDEEFANQEEQSHELEKVIQIGGMYKEWFLDYASYVILERAVPHINDGLKPVQRRILHSMKEMDDGRFHKVANIIGNTMKYHPHGDASIGDALVQIGQKDLLIDCQGNWGNILTGDSAAAPRYIEARLTKFALEVLFNPKTTDWQLSYDGRNREPITLPVKFPYLLTSGIEGIAVGLACKMLPHNFIELIDGSINILKGKKVKIYPDFPTGGLADFSEYNDGLRGGRIKVRSRIAIDDKKTLRISEVPYGTTTSTLIDSILKANDKGKIKIRKVEDNTAEFVEILVHLTGNESPDKMIDALYAFTDCEVSIAPNAGVIENDKPRFIGVSQILEESTEQTKELLKLELQIEKGELQEKWHFASLEKIFIEKRIYRDIEECETWEEILSTIHRGLEPHVKHLIRPVTDDDVTRLTEIRIKRISKFDGYKADEYLSRLEEEIARVQHHLDNLVEYAIEYFKNLKKKYGDGRERKTEIRSLETIERAMVAASNVKLYVQYNEGFVGHGLKKTESEFICDASDIDDIIVIRKDGVMVVTKMNDKTFVGKDILYCNIWKKDDERTIYNMVYQDGSAGKAMVKRFNVTSIVRDREYDLTSGSPKSKVLHLTVNPNGEAEVITVILRAIAKLKKLKFDFDFAEQAIKGRAAKGNILSKYVVNRIDIKEHGISTLSARKVWFDESIKRLNYEERGQYLGAFNGEDKILTVMQSGHYRMTSIDVSTKFDDDMIIIEKWNPNKPISAIYFDPEKEQYYVKRFLAEDSEKLVQFIAETEGSRLEWLSSDWRPMIEIKFDQRAGSKENELINVEEVIAIKGFKAQGNRIAKHKIKTIETLEPLPYEEVEEIEEDEPDDEMDDSDESLEVDEAPIDETKEKPEAAKPVQKIELSAKDKPETTSESVEAETPKPEKENIYSAESGPKKPKLIIKAKKDDDEDSFGAGSQITLEL
ncbi:MAG: DNA gyrase/topoisomerase IV subunit A [Salibacteraceae bacterium]|nr:DNA gyrase/topoisomerase IV subunit A [Salibacteraceae bacterium]MDP4764282.1 DNA gyrase/topoisomerase IV subunit A [Salibacteraceae bacterium]MDP4845118.1 DNA gyrase/topoisomerase IV subunit A [Salibacteraceae bacterium]MDP4965576.1 DNA gyrase/topoisomerase IV subunit A [Salibacteraceae bacterium]